MYLHNETISRLFCTRAQYIPACNNCQSLRNSTWLSVSYFSGLRVFVAKCILCSRAFIVWQCLTYIFIDTRNFQRYVSLVLGDLYYILIMFSAFLLHKSFLRYSGRYAFWAVFWFILSRKLSNCTPELILIRWYPWLISTVRKAPSKISILYKISFTSLSLKRNKTRYITRGHCVCITACTSWIMITLLVLAWKEGVSIRDIVLPRSVAYSIASRKSNK